MRILLLSHYYWPEVGAPQARLREISRSWVEAGHKVTVLTGMPNHPTGTVPEAYRGRLRFLEMDGATRILRTWLYATPNEGFVRKTLGHISFSLSSVLLGLGKIGAQDVVVVSSPTFFSIGSAWVLSRMMRAKLVVEVRDLWPAIFVELGVLTDRALIGFLEKLELTAYRRANAVVVVTKGFRENILSRGIDPAKVVVIPNGADTTFLSPRPPSQAVREKLGAGRGEALVLYVGAHGISQGLATVVSAAARLRGHPVHFAFVGDGAEKQRLVDMVSEQDLNNVTMLPAVPREEIPDLLAAADICIVSLRDIPLFSTFIPSKMFEYLAMGKAVVGSVAGEAASILREAGAEVVEPEHAEQMAFAIAELARDSERRSRMGKEAREYVMENYDRSALAASYLELLYRLTQG